MKSTTPSPGARWRTATAPLRAHWQQLGEREQAGLRLAGWALLVLLVWLITVQPGLRVLRQAPAQREQVERQLQEMQALAQEARELRATPAVPIAQATQALQASTDRLGSAARLTLAGDRAVLTLKDIGPEALQAWLGEARSAARARPVEAKLQRGPKGYSGSIVLSLGGAAS